MVKHSFIAWTQKQICQNWTLIIISFLCKKVVI